MSFGWDINKQVTSWTKEGSKVYSFVALVLLSLCRHEKETAAFSFNMTIPFLHKHFHIEHSIIHPPSLTFAFNWLLETAQSVANIWEDANYFSPPPVIGMASHFNSTSVIWCVCLSQNSIYHLLLSESNLKLSSKCAKQSSSVTSYPCTFDSSMIIGTGATCAVNSNSPYTLAVTLLFFACLWIFKSFSDDNHEPCVALSSWYNDPFTTQLI